MSNSNQSFDKCETEPSLSWPNKIRQLLNSHKFHTLIIVLVCIDCLIVTAELIIEAIDKSLQDQARMNNYKSFLQLLKDMQVHKTLIESSQQHQKMHLILVKLETILKLMSFSILALFIVEILVKLILVPRNFLRFLEIFDAFVITMSFGVNLSLLIAKNDLYIFTGLFTILR
jgi:hypothetical protein